MEQRILLLDGAMGTMIQGHRLDEAGYRGACLASHDHDVKGDNDVLVLTQPDIVRAIHDAYFEAGADIVSSNTFNATSIAQADYGLAGRAREINAAAARLARECADAWTAKTPGKAALRRRRARPDQPHGVDLARRQRSRRAQRPLRRARRLVHRGDRGPGRRRRRHLPRRDDLRHAERQGGAVRARDLFRPPGPALPGDRLRHHHRRVGPHAVGTDDRGVLEFGAARAPARRRHQLLARRGADAPLHRGTGARRGHLRLVLSERRAAESHVRDRLRRDPRARRPGSSRTSRGTVS